MNQEQVKLDNVRYFAQKLDKVMKSTSDVKESLREAKNDIGQDYFTQEDIDEMQNRLLLLNLQAKTTMENLIHSWQELTEPQNEYSKQYFNNLKKENK